MRITEARMLSVSASQMRLARERVAESAEAVSSGLKVNRPSDDPVAWSTARRAMAKHELSAARGTAIAVTQERLLESDRALSTIGGGVSRAKELAVLASNESYDAQDRARVALEIRETFNLVLAEANSRGAEGEFLFAGSMGDVAPFSAAGVYVGDSYQRGVEASVGATVGSAIPGSRLTATSGTDILGALRALEAALQVNDLVAIRTGIAEMDTAVKQVSAVRSETSVLVRTLDEVNETRLDAESLLVQTIARTVQTDNIEAASKMAQSAAAMEAARAVTERIVALVAP